MDTKVSLLAAAAEAEIAEVALRADKSTIRSLRSVLETLNETVDALDTLASGLKAIRHEELLMPRVRRARLEPVDSTVFLALAEPQDANPFSANFRQLLREFSHLIGTRSELYRDLAGCTTRLRCQVARQLLWDRRQELGVTQELISRMEAFETEHLHDAHIQARKGVEPALELLYLLRLAQTNGKRPRNAGGVGKRLAAGETDFFLVPPYEPRRTSASHDASEYRRKAHHSFSGEEIRGMADLRGRVAPNRHSRFSGSDSPKLRRTSLLDVMQSDAAVETKGREKSERRSKRRRDSRRDSMEEDEDPLSSPEAARSRGRSHGGRKDRSGRREKRDKRSKERTADRGHDPAEEDVASVDQRMPRSPKSKKKSGSSFTTRVRKSVSPSSLRSRLSPRAPFRSSPNLSDVADSISPPVPRSKSPRKRKKNKSPGRDTNSSGTGSGIFLIETQTVDGVTSKRMSLKVKAPTISKQKVEGASISLPEASHVERVLSSSSDDIGGAPGSDNPDLPPGFQMQLSPSKLEELLQVQGHLKHTKFDVGDSRSPRRSALARSTSMTTVNEDDSSSGQRTSTTGLHVLQRQRLPPVEERQSPRDEEEMKAEDPEALDSVSRSLSLCDMRSLSELDALDTIEAEKALLSARNLTSTSNARRRKWEAEVRSKSLVAPSETHWVEVGTPTDCSLDVKREEVDSDEVPLGLWYSTYFSGKKHSNYVLELPDSTVAVVSVAKERQLGRSTAKKSWRVLVRYANHTAGALIPPSRVYTLALSRMAIIKENLPADTVQHLLQSVDPMLAAHKSIRKCEENVSKQLLEFEGLEVDRMKRQKHLKVGVLYWKPGNRTEEDMYSNSEVTEAFDAFLSILGDRIEMEGWQGYAGGLEVTDTNGRTSVFTQYGDKDVMFHVGPLLPQSKSNRQQIEKKRHIGNDVVVIVFKEDPAPYLLSTSASQFNHIIIVVSTHTGDQPQSDQVAYKVNICGQHGLPPFGPPLPPGGIFTCPKKLQKFLLEKISCGEQAAVHAPAFSARITRTRRFFLRSMAVVD